jgi:hypothetical protein
MDITNILSAHTTILLVFEMKIGKHFLHATNFAVYDVY